MFIESTENSIERSIKIEFRNITDASVFVLADGKPIEAEVRSDDFLTVTIPCVLPGVIYVVETEFKEDHRKYRDDKFVKALSCLEIPTSIKNELWELHDIDDDKEFMRSIMLKT